MLYWDEVLRFVLSSAGTVESVAFLLLRAVSKARNDGIFSPLPIDPESTGLAR